MSLLVSSKSPLQDMFPQLNGASRPSSSVALGFAYSAVRSARAEKGNLIWNSIVCRLNNHATPPFS